MITPDKEIDAFLDITEVRQEQRLEVAILFARSMVIELQVKVADWEAVADDLEDARRRSLAMTN